MANRSDQDEDTPPNVQGLFKARKAEWDLSSANQQGQRFNTAQTGRTQDRIRPSRQHQQTPCNAGAIHTGHSESLLLGSGGGVESNLGNARDVSDADKGGGAGERACKQDRVVI